jgi:DHA1 family bicyclomycin/chloramphenicol resistance-like MFS transporter
VMIVILSLFFNGTALPMVTAIALCATGAFVLSLITLHRSTALAPAAE